MAPPFNLSSVWRNVKELDLQRIREAADQEIRLVISGSGDRERQTLANQLRTDPRRSDTLTFTPVPLLDLTEAAKIDGEDLILMLVEKSSEPDSIQRNLLRGWSRAGKRVILIVEPGSSLRLDANGFRVVAAALDDWAQLQFRLAPAILEALPDRTLALGRQFPLLRETVARDLITEASAANAVYSFSTGLAEIVPILDIPLNIADMFVLTKAQAMLVYKLGLALGLPRDWQYYVSEFSGVVGSGFLWRQVARSLVGLIPAWGIIPKVAVAYSGTYAVGQAVLYWYLSGRHVTRKMLRGFMRDALKRGKTLGRNLRARLGSVRRKKRPGLPAGDIPLPAGPSPDDRVCTQCSTINDADARFCKNCGAAL